MGKKLSGFCAIIGKQNTEIDRCGGDEKDSTLSNQTFQIPNGPKPSKQNMNIYHS